MPDPVATPASKAKPPGRRRPGPNASKSANRSKNYASENDAAGLDPNFHPDFARNSPKVAGGAAGGAPNGGPSTPRKKNQKNNAAQGKSPAEPGQNQQPATGKANRRNRNGPKNGATPNAAKQPKDGHRTPPAKGTASTGQGGADPSQDPQLSSSAPSTQAFAGNSFHASPAPSALPRPTFMRGAAATAFASPESPRAQPTNGLNLVQQPSPPSSDSELPPATATTGHPLSRNPLFQPATDAAQNASPLDVLFKADRDEKAQQIRRASAANIYNGAPLLPFASPRTDTVSDNTSSYTFPRDVSQQQHQLPVRRPAPSLNRTSSGISAAELDGTPGQPIGPAFATPFQERMRAVKPADIRGSGAAGGHGGFGGGLPGFQNAGPGSQAVPNGNLLTPPLAAQSPGGSSKPSGSELEASLKRMLFSPSGSLSATSPGLAPSMMSNPSRQPAPEFAGRQAAAPYPGAIHPGGGMYAHNASPSHMSHGPPPPVQGRPFGPIDPRFQGAPSPYGGHPYNGLPYNGHPYSGSINGVPNGAPNGGDPSRNANMAVMENSLRQILRLSSDKN